MDEQGVVEVAEQTEGLVAGVIVLEKGVCNARAYIQHSFEREFLRNRLTLVLADGSEASRLASTTGVHFDCFVTSAFVAS